MNNGRYMTLMDLGRIDYTFDKGMAKVLLRNRWYPVLGSSSIRFRRSLKPFQTFQLVTTLVGWDDKWFYMEQRFERQGHVMALAYVKGIFRSKHGNVATSRILAELGQNQESPEISDMIKNLL